ncbi:hypothetical protein BsWGS_28940 [Bradybaena similaris]
MPKAFRKQSYSSIRKECIKKGVLFEDPEFPATSKSLYFSKVVKDVEWLRPKELCKVPRLIVDGISCDDLVTGELTNGWFITACTALAHLPRLWHRVIPDAKNQDFDENNQYAGIFHFHFWRFGEWVDVVVDDRLPCKDGKLIFLHSKQKNEFWSALLEKAYAKMYGDYESLGAGHASDALVDFTGGVSEKLVLKSLNLSDPANKQAFFQKLEEASDNSALINCLIKCDPKLIGTDGPQGLVLGQGYNVTMVKTIEIRRSMQGSVGVPALQMVRVFNPWQTKEWTGPWSDGSEEWQKIPKNEWFKLGVKFASEGEFWMSFDDFISHFTDVDICHFVNTSFFTLKKSWNESLLFGAWSSSGRNGGNVFESKTFLSNPQYVFDITTDEHDSLMVSVEQRDVKADRVAVGDDKNTIGFYIIKVEANRICRVHIQGEQVFRSQFLKSRNVFGSCHLPPGRYVIIPCCENANAVGEFMLRLYTTNKSGARELDKESPTSGCCTGKYKMMTTITVESLEKLELPSTDKGTLDPYIVIKCEGHKVQSGYQKNTTSPVFNLTATFYRKKPSQPITVEVKNHNTMFDHFLCEARITWNGNEKGEQKVIDLFGRKTEAEVQKPGCMHIYIRSSNDLTEL